jgi:nucleotide-binding universal stress UspA family protein
MNLPDMAGSPPFRRILLAVDRSPQSRHAAQIVTEIAAEDAEVHVIHVWNMEVKAVEGRWDVETRTEAQELVSDCADLIAGAGLVVTTGLGQGGGDQIANEIVRAADEFGADVIAMGSRGRSDLGGLLLGSVSHQVVAETERPVLLARGRPKGSPGRRRILVALAGEDEVAPAVAAVLPIARRWAAEVVLFHVARLIAGPYAWVEPDVGLSAAVDEAVARLRSAGVTARGETTVGLQVAGEIARAAEVIDADLVVMGSRRTRELRGLLSGAVDHEVRSRIDAPVLVLDRIQGS